MKLHFLWTDSLLSFLSLLQISSCTAAKTIAVTAPKPIDVQDVGAVVARNFGSFSVEFSFFVDYFGNETHPNVFTRNLLQNLGDLTGAMPIIRVGGSTQDRAVFSPKLTSIPINNTFTVPPGDQPNATTIGPGFFSSFRALPPNITFIPGLNFAINGTAGRVSLLEEAKHSCAALRKGDNLHLWELGNESDFAPGEYRPANFTVQEYADQWVERTRAISAAVKGGMREAGCRTDFWAPSFARSPGSSAVAVNFSADKAFEDGLDVDNRIREISMHNYMNALTSNRTLQGLLMNHTTITLSIAPHLALAKTLSKIEPGIPYLLGESNSVSGQGSNGLTNVFGSALWVVDYSLWIASAGIERLHLHQGTGFRYASWQPIVINQTQPETRPPYYGNILVAKAIGSNTSSNSTRIVNLELDTGDDDGTEVAYAVYDDDVLRRAVLLNLEVFTTINATAGIARGSKTFTIDGLPESVTEAMVERLTADGADVTEGVTFGGVSYDFGLDEGKPVAVSNNGSESVEVVDGVLSVDISASEAVLVSFL